MTTRGAGYRSRTLVDGADEVVEHALRDVEVGDDAVFEGRTAMMLAGVRPTMRLASAPMASTFLVTRSIATTLGSSMTMPRPLTMTSVLAVPR